MRELLCVFSGNELVFGIVLGNWLLLTGIGSSLGRTASRLARPLDALVAAQTLVAVLPIADVFLLRALRNVVFIRGAEVGVTETVLSCFVLLAPYCLIAGYLLTLACRVVGASDDSASIGRVYFLDTAGGVASGLAFTYVLIYWLDHFEILYFPAALNLATAGAVAWVFGRRVLLAGVAAVAALSIGLAATCDLDALSIRLEYPGQKVVYSGHSPYGSLIVTESPGQCDFIASGVPLFSTNDVEKVEETVHYAMAQRPDARRVLLISGGVSGTAREILKYGVEAIDYVELDPQIIEVARRFVPESLADPRIHVVTTDGRLFVGQAFQPQQYDVVIVDVPDPSTSQINRFYTEEFFEEVKRILRPDGVLCFSLGHYENYLSEELAGLIAVADRTAKTVFRNVLVLPGGRIFFLASDGELTLDIADRLKAAGVRTRWVTRPYLVATLTADRLADIRRAVEEPAPVNRDFNPVLYYRHLLYWMSQFKVRFGLLEAGLLVLLGVYLARIRPVPFALFTTGFAASALEVVILLGVQILYGCVYQQVGLIVTVFMLGLGIGSHLMNRNLVRFHLRDLAKLELAIAACAAGLPLVLIALGKLGGTLAPLASQVVMPLATLVLAVVVGMEFPLAGKEDFQAVTATAARLYTADYVGAALGALLVSTLLIPVLGVITVCLLAAALNVVSGGIILRASRPVARTARRFPA
jgi:spermidine synthase